MKMVLANAEEPFVLRKNQLIRTKNLTTVTRRPRIISVSAIGGAYLWELELSIGIHNGEEVVHLNVPPPLASMDGMVAAISGSGMPVVYPPALSSTSIADLSPFSPWYKLDEVNSQFKVSYNPHHDVFCWVFSPDCIGSSLRPNASREEQLNVNGVMVCWKLSELPLHAEWPPPLLSPHCVFQLPRTKNGSVASDMVTGPGLLLNHQVLSTVYVTSSDELIVLDADFKERGQSIHLESRVSMLADLKSFECIDKRGFTCFSIAASFNIDCPLIAIGTQYGVLFSSLTRGKPQVSSEQVPAEHHASLSSVHRISDISFEQMWSVSGQRQSLLAERVKELECRNNELEFQLDSLIQEAHDTFSDKEWSGLPCHSNGVLETELGAALVTIERLENEVKFKNESCEALESKVEALEANLEKVNQELVQERQTHQATLLKRAAAEDTMVAASVKEADCRQICLQEDCNCRRDKIEEIVDDADICNDRKGLGLDVNLQIELANANEYITRLEEEIAVKDNELREASRKAVEYAQRQSELIANVEAQDLALESLVRLLELQRVKYEENTAAQHDEYNFVKGRMANQAD